MVAAASRRVAPAARRDHPGGAGGVAAPEAGGHRLAVRIVRPIRPLDSGPEASNTPAMDDPLVAALAQLVRDRWAAERRERAARGARVRVVEGTR